MINKKEAIEENQSKTNDDLLVTPKVTAVSTKTKVVSEKPIAVTRTRTPRAVSTKTAQPRSNSKVVKVATTKVISEDVMVKTQPNNNENNEIMKVEEKEKEKKAKAKKKAKVKKEKQKEKDKEKKKKAKKKEKAKKQKAKDKAKLKKKEQAKKKSKKKSKSKKK